VLVLGDCRSDLVVDSPARVAIDQHSDSVERNTLQADRAMDAGYLERLLTFAGCGNVDSV
jgi:hypothetical protein